MNCQRVREIWDEYRDGTLDEYDAGGLEQHLADCPRCEKLWRGESAWLSVLGEKAPMASEQDAAAFTAAVMRRWDRQHHRPSIAARIGRLTAAAAVIAVMLSLAAVMVKHREGSGPPASIATGAQRPEQIDSIGVLIAGIDAPAMAVRQAFNSSSAYLDGERYVDRFVELLDAAEPRSGADRSTNMN